MKSAEKKTTKEVETTVGVLRTASKGVIWRGNAKTQIRQSIKVLGLMSDPLTEKKTSKVTEKKAMKKRRKARIKSRRARIKNRK